MKKFSYHQRLAKLKLESLELRWLHADVLFTYKLVFGITDLKLSDFLSQISVEQAAATNTNYTCPLAKAEQWSEVKWSEVSRV